MHIDNVIFLILSKIAYTKFSEGPADKEKCHPQRHLAAVAGLWAGLCSDGRVILRRIGRFRGRELGDLRLLRVAADGAGVLLFALCDLGGFLRHLPLAVLISELNWNRIALEKAALLRPFLSGFRISSFSVLLRISRRKCCRVLPERHTLRKKQRFARQWAERVWRSESGLPDYRTEAYYS